MAKCSFYVPNKHLLKYLHKLTEGSLRASLSFSEFTYIYIYYSRPIADIKKEKKIKLQHSLKDSIGFDMLLCKISFLSDTDIQEDTIWFESR